jgi:transaldolase/glucose-6-phosphate isomerase
MIKVNYFLPDEINNRIKNRLDNWKKEKYSQRLWNNDPTIWKEKLEEDVELSDRLGWLNLPEEMLEKIKELEMFSNEVKKDFKNVLLLGMGGSSLAPEVFSKTYGSKIGYPRLEILDSTHPDVVDKFLKEYDLTATLFIVASKSGGTAETMSFYYTFFEAVSKFNENPGNQFVAITDPGSGLEKLAKEKKFRKIFNTPPKVGGRYSALTYFGMLPAALIGMDIEKFLTNADQIVKQSGSNINAADNLGFFLGAAIGELALIKKDKLTFFCSKNISSFPSWIEQLVAESTGKEEKGILPIVDEEFVDTSFYENDRVFVFLEVDEHNFEMTNLKEKLSKNFPLISIQIDNLYELSQQFYLWEMATALSGAVLKINPFDQPDVQLAKTLANESLSSYKTNGKLPVSIPKYSENNVEVYCSTDGKSIKENLADFFASIKHGDYVGINAFIPYGKEIENILGKLRQKINSEYKIATTLGFGPRFLHSTGQLHKGGPNNGLFIQITNETETNIDVPSKGYSFDVLITAQAQGDLQALMNRKRRTIRFNIKGNLIDGLNNIFF